MGGIYRRRWIVGDGGSDGEKRGRRALSITFIFFEIFDKSEVEFELTLELELEVFSSIPAPASMSWSSTRLCLSPITGDGCMDDRKMIKWSQCIGHLEDERMVTYRGIASVFAHFEGSSHRSFQRQHPRRERRAISPFFISFTPLSHPLMTWPLPSLNLNGSLRSLLESNTVPSVNRPT